MKSFRSDQRDAFVSSPIRASINSAPNAEDLEAMPDGDSGLEKNRNAAIVDEAIRQIRSYHLVEAELSDFHKLWAELELVLPDVHQQLYCVRLALRPILSG